MHSNHDAACGCEKFADCAILSASVMRAIRHVGRTYLGDDRFLGAQRSCPARDQRITKVSCEHIHLSSLQTLQLQTLGRWVERSNQVGDNVRSTTELSMTRLLRNAIHWL
jgi:hypothetical protein